MIETDKGYNLMIKIADDYYTAYLSVEVTSDQPRITQEDIVDALKRKNVTFGIKYDLISSLVNNPRNLENEVVAMGITHEHGVDGYITFTHDNGEDKPTVLDDGSVDFKSTNFVNQVVANEVLAAMTAPTTGQNGTTVTNRMIKARPGKAVNFKIGKNVGVTPDGASAFAMCDGALDQTDGKLQVIKVLEIRQDVGIATGNIDFVGDVIIYGNVTTGYSVKTEGNISVNGIIESANIEATGDVIINGGVQGNDQCNIVSGGKVTSKFINNAYLRVEGDIETAAIVHCKVFCNGTLTSKGKKGIIVGGEVNVKQNIVATTIGSDLGIITVLKLGVDAETIEEMKLVTTRTKELKESVENLKKDQKLLLEKFKVIKAANIKQKIEKVTKKLNEDNDEFKRNIARMRELNELIMNLRSSKVSAGLMYQGTRVRIGTYSYNVKDSVKGCEIKIVNNEIKAVSI